MAPSPDPSDGLSYAATGVRSFEAGAGLGGLAATIAGTFAHRAAGRGRVALPLGYFANVIELTPDLGLALSTDGVGTKIRIAEQLGRFDTIGIDCVAMNVNDILCVGAEPLALLDYIAVQEARPELLTDLARGLAEGARQANITIPGGEIAQVAELLRGLEEGSGFDLVATAVGTVALDRVIIGQAVTEGDVVLGLASAGLHSNGYTLARRALLDRAGLRLTEQRPELGRTLGEELLEPTRIYVREVLAVLAAGIGVRALAHITGDGLLNLARIAAPAGFVLDNLPEPPPICALIRSAGQIDNAEMYRVFNQGVGFCLVIAARDVERAEAVLREHGQAPDRLGYAVADAERRIQLPALGLTGHGGRFTPSGT